jgi:FtsZ-binding cell division protein ZapB
MDKLKEKLNTLRQEADEAIARADATETDLKRVETSIANKGKSNLRRCTTSH